MYPSTPCKETDAESNIYPSPPSSSPPLQSASQLDLVMAGTRSAVLMIEGFASFLPEADMLAAVEAGAAAIADVAEQMEAWAAVRGLHA